MDKLIPAPDLAAKRRPLFAGERADYARARQALLAEEIEVRRHLSRVADQRGALPPGPVIEKDYRFLDAKGAELKLIDLFGPHDTLVTYFWMYGPERKRPCPMCTNFLGPLDANDIMQKVALKVLGRSPVARQLEFARERGWAALEFLQTVGDDYAGDQGLLTPDGEFPSLVVFRRDGDTVRLFWAGEILGEMADPNQDGRGAPDMAPLWNILDITPAGRDAKWYPKLDY